MLWRGSGKERRVGWSGCEYDLSRFSCWDSGLGGRERERGRAEAEADPIRFLVAFLSFRMATCSTPAGWVPQFLTDRSVAGEVAKDVPLFLEWVEKGRPGI